MLQERYQPRVRVMFPGSSGGMGTAKSVGIADDL
jgi:hypothetical protein